MYALKGNLFAVEIKGYKLLKVIIYFILFNCFHKEAW